MIQSIGASKKTVIYTDPESTTAGDSNSKKSSPGNSKRKPLQSIGNTQNGPSATEAEDAVISKKPAAAAEEEMSSDENGVIYIPPPPPAQTTAPAVSTNPITAEERKKKYEELKRQLAMIEGEESDASEERGIPLPLRCCFESSIACI